MLSRIAALLPLCSHVRVLVSAARPKESSFLQSRAKFSEGRSERPDVTAHGWPNLSFSELKLMWNPEWSLVCLAKFCACQARRYKRSINSAQ
jgi:hypothetical protein